MGRWRVMLAVAGALGLMGSQAWTLPTTEEIVEQMKARFAEMRSLELEMKTYRVDGEHRITVATGKLLMERKAVRREIMWTGSLLFRTDRSRTRINDGAFVWEEERTERRVHVRKTKAREPDEGSFTYALVRNFERDSQRFGLKVTGEETLDGQKTYRLEGATDTGKEGMKVWVGQDDLVIRRTEKRGSPDDGKEVAGSTVVELSNVKVNGEVDPKVFEYTPPEGAEVKDLTKD